MCEAAVYRIVSAFSYMVKIDSLMWRFAVFGNAQLALHAGERGHPECGVSGGA